MAARSLQFVLIALASLAVGFALGSHRSRGSVEVANAAGPLAAARPGEALGVGLPSRDSGLAAPESGGSRTSAVLGRPVAELPEAPRPEPALVGSGSSEITGVVTTLEGTAVAGVELELEAPKEAPRYRVRRTTSDAEGRFAFDELPRGVWRLTGRHPQYVLQRLNSFPPLVPTGAEVPFLATPAVAVEVRVTGEQAERARVAVRRMGDDEPIWSPWTSEEPLLALSPGAWELCASVDALDEWPSDRHWKLAPLASPVTVVHVTGGGAAAIVLPLERARCLYGRVLLHSGGQAEDDVPAVMLVETQSGIPADFEVPGERLVRQCELDAQGRYGFFALPYPSWTAGVSPNSWSKPGAVEVADVEGLTWLDLVQGADSEGGVRVEAFTADGERITAGIQFFLLHRNPEDRRQDYVWRYTRTVLEAGGVLQVIALPLDGDALERATAKRELVLRATLAGFATLEQTLRGLDDEHLELHFAPGASLELLLVGDGAERAMRKCRATLQNDGQYGHAVYDEAARALRFHGLDPGNYKLSVMVWGQDEIGRWRQVPLHEGETLVQAGAQQLVLEMPERAPFVVRCPGIKEGTVATLIGPLLDPLADSDAYGGSSGRFHAEVDGRGEARFEGVVAGEYRLTIGPRMQRVQVPCPPLEFEGRIPERHRFRLPTRDTPLRRAGVRSGDVLVALDGQAVSTEVALSRLRTLSSQSSGTLRLTIEREGETQEVLLDAAALEQNSSFEVPLEPVLD
jgi:hypothetical protein